MPVNYGANKLRFPLPVPVSAMVQAGVELASVMSGRSGYQVVTRVTTERDGGDKLACVVDASSVLLP